MNINSLDAVFFKDLDVHCSIGYSEDERAFPQKLLISLTAYCEALRLDAELEEGVCYDQLKQWTLETTHQKKWVLVEHLAEAISQNVLSQNAQVRAVKIHVKKFALPGVGYSGVEILRCAQER